MFDWNQPAAVNIDRYFPLKNFAGKVYLTYTDNLLEQQLNITPGEKVLDIGGGSRPFQRANVVTEAYLADGAHRSGLKLDSSTDYVQCFAENLPFADQEFDVAVSRHVLEHVTDPAAACREMMRVAGRGYIETPSYFNSCLSDYPAHRWIVTQRQGRLVFEKKKWVLNPFRNAVRGLYYADAEYRFNMDFAYRNLACTQFYWEGRFDFEVIDDPRGVFDYDHPETAALAHLDYAVNALRYGFIPYDEILAELETALNYTPGLALAHYHKGIIYRLTGNGKKAAGCFRTAVKLDNSLGKPAAENYPVKPLELSGFTGSNFAGPVFPLVRGFEDSLVKALKLRSNSRVLELSQQRFLSGSDHIQLPEALSVKPNYFANRRKYNLSIVSGLVEKHPDPENLFKEIMRISGRGIIEVPSELWEYFNGDPANIWLFSVENGVLVIRRKPFTVSPFPLVISRHTVKYPELALAFGLVYRNITYIQLYWSKEIPYKLLF